MFIRFVVSMLDLRSGRRQGLFQAAADLRDTHALRDHEESRFQEIRDWFNKHLEKPSRMSLSPRPHAKDQALSWFKDTATEHISQMRAFAAILELHDIQVEIIKTDRPGYIFYEDDFQVAAYPFADTVT
jgi:hypothetical protein